MVKKGLDNGLLILFAYNGGKNNVRISTGYGVEDILTDAQSNDILMKNKPLLKSSDTSDVDRGIDNVFQSVSKIISKRYANKSLQQIKKRPSCQKTYQYDSFYYFIYSLNRGYFNRD
ncbi:TPM domain-containing protein [Apilactobacillus ozensis]|uniref:TPM domain-containing protein n=1 Tax=Apilactobacillus ozensis TaxID=866801 RepID=UPI0006D087B3|nr:TPM domain-containing protein [Apilactobacillus ozensis]